MDVKDQCNNLRNALRASGTLSECQEVDKTCSQSVFALGLGSSAFQMTVPATAPAIGATQYTKKNCWSMLTDLSYTYCSKRDELGGARVFQAGGRGGGKISVIRPQ